MAISRFARINKPLVTVFNGPAAGAGLSRRHTSRSHTPPSVYRRTAARLGLVTRVVDAGILEPETRRVASALAASATAALGRTRNLLLSSFGATFETQMELEARAIAESSRSRENREGVAAFLEKRKPNFADPA